MAIEWLTYTLLYNDYLPAGETHSDEYPNVAIGTFPYYHDLQFEVDSVINPVGSTLELVSGTLPDGLTIDFDTYEISGTPTQLCSIANENIPFNQWYLNGDGNRTADPINYTFTLRATGPETPGVPEEPDGDSCRTIDFYEPPIELYKDYIDSETVNDIIVSPSKYYDCDDNGDRFCKNRFEINGDAFDVYVDIYVKNGGAFSLEQSLSFESGYPNLTSQEGDFVYDDTITWDRYYYPLDISMDGTGSIITISSILNNDLKIYKRVDSTWTLSQTITDIFRVSAKLSGNGDVLIITNMDFEHAYDDSFYSMISVESYRKDVGGVYQLDTNVNVNITEKPFDFGTAGETDLDIIRTNRRNEFLTYHLTQHETHGQNIISLISLSLDAAIINIHLNILSWGIISTGYLNKLCAITNEEGNMTLTGYTNNTSHVPLSTSSSGNSLSTIEPGNY